MRILALVPLLLALGCQTRVVTSPAWSAEAVPAYSQAARAWEVVERGQVVGVVIEFDAQGGRRFYSVRNAWHQELGLVDSMGRAWRYRPHAREADWLGSGTLIEGAAQVLGIGGQAELFEVRLEQLQDDVRTIADAGVTLD